MSSVTYKNQPAIHKTGGSVPVSGTAIPYQVKKLLWPSHVQGWIAERLVGKVLHICCGLSLLGDCRLDLFAERVDVRADAARLPFGSGSWDTVLIDPPYNGVFQWNHDMLSELSRVAKRRIIFQHWFIPADKFGRYKKLNKFVLSDMGVWQGQTYFGRAQIISIFDDLTNVDK